MFLDGQKEHKVSNYIGKDSFVLDDKVDQFINWYFENMVKDQYSKIGEYHLPIAMKNFIEKVAVWYELRYPDYEINRLMPGSSQEAKQINHVMFHNNQYINDLLDETSEIKDLNWDEFYNTEVFIHSLPWNERRFFLDPRYKTIKHDDAYIYLSQDGIIQKTENLNTLDIWLNDKERINIDSDFTGKSIEELVKYLQERAPNSEIYKKIQKIVSVYNNQVYQKNELLNCVMYRIIERGGNRIGPRRAYLFAQEFGRNTSIPMMYGVDRSDPGLRKFINQYLKDGGSKDLICYIGYFFRSSKYQKLETITIQELILNQWNSMTNKYTKEEDDLHQKLINILSNIDPKEREKQLRLKRK